MIKLSLFLAYWLLSMVANGATCWFDQVAFDDEHLSCMTRSPVVQGIKSNFRVLNALKRECPKCVDRYPDAFRREHLYNRDFLALAVGPRDFGGFYVLAMFRSEPTLYELWLYEIDEGVFQLRAFEPEEPHELIKQEMDSMAKSDRYARYWLNAFDEWLDFFPPEKQEKRQDFDLF